MTLIVMCENGNRKFLTLSTQYPGRLGWLFVPKTWRTPVAEIPYAIDNGRYVCHVKGTQWEPEHFFCLLDKAQACEQKPEWVAVPDVVADRTGTLYQWDYWAPKVEKYGWPLAMVVQDGMTPKDVPPGVVCFVGGTGAWKWLHLAHFAGECKRVHVGRVNTLDRLWECHWLGCESVDGTGWFRDPKRNHAAWLETYLDLATQGKQPTQPRLFTWEIENMQRSLTEEASNV